VTTRAIVASAGAGLLESAAQRDSKLLDFGTTVGVNMVADQYSNVLLRSCLLSSCTSARMPLFKPQEVMFT
jgi:hypothetical protein